MLEHSEARLAMVRSQLLPNKVTDERITTAMGVVPRERFVPKAMRGVAYMDDDVEIAPGRYLMEPMVFARLLQAAGLDGDEVVLDLGCATGYSTAVLAQLANMVVALESDADLAAKANENLAALEVGNAVVVQGALAAGYGDQAPYDVIVVEGAAEEVSETLLGQLAEGGRLVAVVNEGGVGQARLYRRQDGGIAQRVLFDANVPRLAELAVRRGFAF